MKLSRRGFITAGAAAGATVMAAGSAALADETVSVGNDDGTYNVRNTGAEQFAIAPAKAGDLGEPDMTCDWLVIGGGNCGIFAALHGAELGMNTVLLEKATHTGGGGAGTEATQILNDAKYLAESGSPCGSPSEVYHYFQMQNAWESDAMLVSNYLRNVHFPHDWLYDQGLPIVFCASGGVEAPVGGIMYEGEGMAVNAAALKGFETAGGRTMLSTAATQLVVDESGAVVGALATSEDGDVYISAKNTFVGTGGFGTNADMVDFYLGETGNRAYKYDLQLQVPHDGDGIRMMFGIGAVESNDMWAFAPSAASPAHSLWDSKVDRCSREPNLWVNIHGERVGNEKESAISSGAGYCLRQPEGTFWNVFDAAAARRMEEGPVFGASRWTLPIEGDNAPIDGASEALDEGVANGECFKADSLEELCSQTGIDYSGLQATVKHYNELCEAGEDTDLFKDSTMLFGIGEAPFYAIEMTAGWYSTLNGVRINSDLQPVDAFGNPIQGLYAGGADAGEFFKTMYSHGFGGSCSAFSYFCGWFAADKAFEGMGALLSILPCDNGAFIRLASRPFGSAGPAFFQRAGPQRRRG